MVLVIDSSFTKSLLVGATSWDFLNMESWSILPGPFLPQYFVYPKKSRNVSLVDGEFVHIKGKNEEVGKIRRKSVTEKKIFMVFLV